LDDTHDTMAARTSSEAAHQQNAYYDLSAQQDKPVASTSHGVNPIQPEPHGPNQMYAKDASHVGEKGIGKTGDIMVDVEKGGMSPAPTQSDSRDEIEEPKTKKAMWLKRAGPFFSAFVWLLFTGWWIAGLVLHRPGTAHPKNWVVPFLLWLAITIRIVTLYIPATIVYKPLQMIWRNTVSRVIHMIPEKLRIPLGALGTVAVIVVGGFASPTAGDNNLANRGISLLGLALLILGMWATSRNRKAVNWHTIIMGMVCSRANRIAHAIIVRLTFTSSSNSSSRFSFSAQALVTISSPSSPSWRVSCLVSPAMVLSS
jgi:CNT family concentrative nucleoside transporter